MGAVNYFTSDYITMGVQMINSCDLDFMENAREEVKTVPTWKQYERETA